MTTTQRVTVDIRALNIAQALNIVQWYRDQGYDDTRLFDGAVVVECSQCTVTEQAGVIGHGVECPHDDTT